MSVTLLPSNYQYSSDADSNEQVVFFLTVEKSGPYCCDKAMESRTLSGNCCTLEIIHWRIEGGAKGALAPPPPPPP